MRNDFFPNETDKLDYVMQVYENEIATRHEWIIENVEKLNKANLESSASITISYAMSIVNHAMLVLRLVDKKAVGAREFEKKKAKERAKILHERNPGLPTPPQSLRRIRNDYEHFESRLDEWATSANPSYFIDLNVGNGISVTDANPKDELRSLVDTKLIFWNNSVDLQEIIDWVNEMIFLIKTLK